MATATKKSAEQLINRILPSSNGEPKSKEPKPEEISITPPNFKELRVPIRGTTPLVQCKFSIKARQTMMETQQAGQQAKKGKKREPKDFEKVYNDSRHIAVEKWDGINAIGFRHALVDTGKMCGFFKVIGKQALFVVADGFTIDGIPLVKITKGEPRMHISEARASGKTDLRSRPMWDAGWEAIVKIEYDADVFSATEVINLMARVGKQNGVGEGRANSKASVGCGWGHFEVIVGEVN